MKGIGRYASSKLFDKLISACKRLQASNENPIRK